MGGFGAIRLGLKYPEKFCSIFAHSSRIPVNNDVFVKTDQRWYALFGDRVTDDLDCYFLARQVDHDNLPILSFDCGLDDHLLGDNRRFHEYLDRMNFPHTYSEHFGGHYWTYWSDRLKEAMLQHVRVLNRIK